MKYIHYIYIDHEKGNKFQCLSHLPWICHCGTLNHREHSMRVFSANLLGGFLKTAISRVLCDTKFHNAASINNAASKLHLLLSSLTTFSVGTDSEHSCSPLTIPVPLPTLSVLANPTGFLCSSCSISQQRRPRLNSPLCYREQYFEILLSSYHWEKCNSYHHRLKTSER